MTPIFVECTMVNLKTGLIMGKFMKTFEIFGDFMTWYKENKNDTSMIINIMKYNPGEKARLKDVYDVKLLSVSRELPV